jgi:prepilin-type N-terminal cleavage/methylation domain-containing protein
VSSESGFTLIEVVMVVLIIGILTAVAIPSYISLQTRADQSAANSTVRAAVSDVEAYYADNGTFQNISVGTLKTRYDSTLDTTNLYIEAVDANGGTNNSFMLCAKSNSRYAYKDGPAGQILPATAAPTHCSL